MSNKTEAFLQEFRSRLRDLSLEVFDRCPEDLRSPTGEALPNILCWVQLLTEEAGRISAASTALGIPRDVKDRLRSKAYMDGFREFTRDHERACKDPQCAARLNLETEAFPN